LAPATAAIAALLTVALPIGEAAAQFSRRSMPRPVPEEARTPPPALPGLQGRRAPAPIPADPDQNLGPNDALFDAINRGDLPAAREAINRGADVESRNVLGLTPIDSAVDQGRTEILFYLMSVRGTAARGGTSGPPQAAPTPPPPPRNSAAARRAEREAAAAAARDANRPATTEARATPPTPRLWAGDGGAAIPDIGFLGFDAGRPAGASAPPAERGVQQRHGGGRSRG
jgi:hypothetical protein